MNLSDLTALATLPTLTAGMAIAKGDLVQLTELAGTAIPTKITNYARTAEYSSSLMAQLQIVSSYSSRSYYREAVVQGTIAEANGNIYCVAQSGSNTGLTLYKQNAIGASPASVILSSTDTYHAHRVFNLSNGNILAISYTTVNNTIRYAIYNPDLVLVKTLTALAASASNAYYFGVCTLSGGGFAVVHQTSATPLESTLLTFDNNGTAVLAATTVFTRTGTTGMQYHDMVQLSNGNLAIAVSSANSVSSIGLFHGVVTTAGVSVLAFTSLDTTSSTAIPQIATLPGYYAIARPNGTTQRAYVFSNAGALQGTAFSATSTNSTRNKTKILSDGTQFWLIWQDTTNSKSQLTKLPTTGTGYLNNERTFYNNYVDAFYDNGIIVSAEQDNSGTVVYLNTQSAVTGSITSYGTQTISTGNITTGLSQRMISGGDGAYICLYDILDSATLMLRAGKYTSTAIVGVAAAAAAAGALVPVIQTVGNYACNQVGGAPSFAFDMSASTVRGNKGSLLAKSVNLKGI